MKKTSRHPVDREAARKQEAMAARVMKATIGPARERPSFLSTLLNTAREYAGALAVAEPESPQLCAALRLGAQAAAALFAAASAGSGVVEAPLGDGPPARLPATGATDSTDFANWRSGFFMAAVCRDRRSLDTLGQTPMDVLRGSSTKGDECMYLFAHALQGLWRREPDTAKRVQAALEATDPTRLSISPEEFVLNVTVPELELVFRFLLGEAAAFNEALSFALERHKKYWGKGDRKRDTLGWLALGPLAMASFAHDAGRPVEVESDYLPMRLVHGDCAGAAG
jgi:hypothetical protein